MPDAHDASAMWELLMPDGGATLVAQASCRRFAVMDPAATEAGEGRRPCYTVIQVWDVTPMHDMLLVHQYRQQVQAPDAAAAAARIVRQFNCDFIAIEKDGIGLGIVQSVKRTGIAVRAIKARGSKAARSQTAEIRMANGQIYFRQGAAYLFDLESELLQFPQSHYCDQADALSHAAMVVQRLGEPVRNEEATVSQAEQQDAFDDET
jgi:predicted phage terminase large subunit-like protein